MLGSTVVSAPAGEATKAEIFISYSRKDMSFADRLQAELEARGFDPLIDRTEIYAFEDWWTRIQALIVKADTIIFVLSPDAVASDICAKEVAFAASLNKRFAPIVCQRVDDNAVPEALRRLNFIFFDDDSRFDASMTQLVEALQTDIEWVRKHTEFGEAARRWSQAGRPGPRGLLLRSPALDEAERWIATRPHGAPNPTDSTQAFIAESRKAATRRRNMLTAALSVGLTLALGLLGLAYAAFYSAERQRNDALITQSQFLARDARSATASGRATLGALLALAALPKDLAQPDRPFVSEAEYALQDAYANFREQLLLDVRPGNQSYSFPSYAEFSPDGRRILAVVNPKVEIWDAQTGARVVTMEDHDMPAILGARFSPDGRRVFTAGEGDKILRVWDAETGAVLLRLQHDVMVLSASMSGDGRKIVTRTLDGIARIWDADTGVLLQRFGSPSAYGDFANFSPNGKRLVVAVPVDGGRSGLADAIVYDIESGAMLTKLAANRSLIKAAVYSPDGALIATADIDATVKLWDAETGAEKFTLRGHDKPVLSLDFSPDGATLVTAGLDGTAALWNVKTGALIAIMRGHQQIIDHASFSPDGRFIATSSRDGTARLWSADNGGLIAVLPQVDASSNDVFSAKFSPDSRKIVTTATDHYVRVWNVNTRLQQQAAVAFPEPCFSSTIALSPDGGTLLCNSTTEMYLMELSTRKILRQTQHDGSGALAYSHGGNLIATGSYDGTVDIWDAKTLTKLVALHGHTNAVNVVVFSPNDDRLISGAEQAIVWDVGTWAQVKTLAGHQNMVNRIAISPDGRVIATIDGKIDVRLWDAASGEIPARKKGADLAFSPDSKRLALAEEMFGAIIWDIASGQEIKTRASGHQEAHQVAFSPDGRLLLTNDPNAHRALLWDASTGSEILAYTGHNDFLLAAGFAPNPPRVITATAKAFWVWDLPPRCQSLIDTARGELRRGLTDEERSRYFLEHEATPDANWLVTAARRIFAFVLPGTTAACT